MNLARIHTLLGAAVSIMVLALAVPAKDATAACSYLAMSRGAVYPISADPTLGSTTSPSGSWAVWAVRPATGEDWDMSLFNSTAADPTCVTGNLAGSAGGTGYVDLVVSDFGHVAGAPMYPRFNRYGAGSASARVVYDHTQTPVVVNGPTLSLSWTANDVAAIWSVTLEAGVSYRVVFSHASGIDARLVVFRNNGTSGYVVGRGYALQSFSTSGDLLAPASDEYAFVLVNDNGGSGTVDWSIGRCDMPELASGVPVLGTPGFSYWTFVPTANYWSVVAARPTGSADYSVSLHPNQAGPGYPNCFDSSESWDRGEMGYPALGVVDFNQQTIGRTGVSSRFQTSGTGTVAVEWKGTANALIVNGPPASATYATGELAKVWDVFLEAGTTYNFVVHPYLADAQLTLYDNTTSATNYFGGDDAVKTIYAGCGSFTATGSGWYGVVVSSRNAQARTVRLSVTTAPCACPTDLSSGTPAPTVATDSYFLAHRSAYRGWSVMATRGATESDDWDVWVGTQVSGQAPPDCIGSVMGGSSLGGGVVDLVAMRFADGVHDTVYARTHLFYGESGAGLVQYAQPGAALSNTGPTVVGVFTASDLCAVHDGMMWSGTTYGIEFTPGAAGQKLLLFEASASGTPFIARASKVLEVSGPTGFTQTVTYAPGWTGERAFVVVNDAGTAGSYALRYGTCPTPTALASATPFSATQGVEVRTVTPVAGRWGAVGVRSLSRDWDIAVASSGGTSFPNCIGPWMAASISSATPLVDVVVGDFHHTPATTWYVDAHQFSETPFEAARIEWEAGRGALLPNDSAPVSGSTGPTDVLNAYEVNLTAGQTYQFYLAHYGTASLRLLVFRNPSSASYWAGRDQAEVDMPVASVTTSYTAPATDDYAVVVVNDDGGSDSYQLAVRTCPTPLPALASGVAVSGVPAMFHSFDQQDHYWTAVGVRSTSDWDIELYQGASGGAVGVCFSNQLTASTAVGVADFVVGDFNTGADPLASYYVRSYRYSGDGVGTVEWDSDTDMLYMGDPPATLPTGAGDVLTIWDVWLAAGSTYGFYFSHSPGTDMKAMLFRNPGGLYWAPRSARVKESSGSFDYVAPSTGYYGVVVVNDNGASGTYSIGVSRGGVAVEDAASPVTTALRGVSPNPAKGAMTVEFALREPAPVRVEMLDLTGRRVAVIAEGTRDAGEWRIPWSGRSGDASRLPAGVYVVRLLVGGQPIGERKVAWLE